MVHGPSSIKGIYVALNADAYNAVRCARVMPRTLHPDIPDCYFEIRKLYTEKGIFEKHFLVFGCLWVVFANDTFFNDAALVKTALASARRLLGGRAAPGGDTNVPLAVY